MAKVKFNTRMLDKSTNTMFEKSDKFVEVSKKFEQRIKEIQKKDERHKDSFVFEGKEGETEAQKLAKAEAKKAKDEADKADKQAVDQTKAK